MNQLFSIGKSLINKGGSNSGEENSSSSGGSGGFGNPIAMFQQLDRNGDGSITEDDFVLAVQSLGLGSVGDYAVRNAFKRIDKNRNGKLEMSEAMAAFELIKSIFQSQGGAAN